MDDSVFARVEAQRTELEANIAKLKKALHHWQTLELDYEGLREEFHLLPENSTLEQCLETAREFQPVIVDDKDLQSLLKDTKSVSRNPQQLAHVLSKRVEYVGKNAETIKRQLVDAEKKRNALLLAQDPEHRDEAALPLAEITEELDDSGNVISSKVERPDSNVSQVVEAIEKAGVGDLDKVAMLAEGTQPSARATESSPSRSDDDQSDDEESSNDAIVPSAASTSAPGNETRNIPPPSNPFDTADEARLREEMLEYRGMDEVGAIVAELDLAEGSSDVSYDPDEDDMMIGSDLEDELDEDDESEDDTGKAKHPLISEAYKRKMQELEESLGLKDMANLGPDPSLPADVKRQLDRPPAAEAARKAALARQEKIQQSRQAKNESDAKKGALKTSHRGEKNAGEAQKKPKKKSVAFSEALDVAKEDQAPSKQAPSPRTKSKVTVNPLSESVIERATDIENISSTAPPAPPKKLSRFKQARGSQPPAPIAPEDRPLVSPQVFERATTNDPTLNLPPDPDSIDDELHRREIALEYHKLRNRRIHDQGGFAGYDEDGEEEDWDDGMLDYGVVDPSTGEMKKVSRFKAARVRG